MILDLSWETSVLGNIAPAIPIKCGGAAQKITFLAKETFVTEKVREHSQVSFYTGGVIFGVRVYADAFQKVADRKKRDYRFKHDLKAIHPGAEGGSLLPDHRRRDR